MLVALDRHDAKAPSHQPAGGALIAFYCIVCGYLLTAQDRQPRSASTCAGSMARSGKRHESTPMQPLLLH